MKHPKGLGEISLANLEILKNKGGVVDLRTTNITEYNTTRLINLGYLKLGKLTCTSGHRIALTTKAKKLCHLSTVTHY